jgi:hypothetical protein
MDPAYESLMKMAAGDDWAWAAAIAETESGFSPYAYLSAGAHGEPSFGIFQMHDTFIADHLRDQFQRAEAIYCARGNPFVQAAAFNAFWKRYSAETPENRALIYHYGHAGHEAKMAEAKAALASNLKADATAIIDPDGYLEEVMANYDAIAPAAKEAEKDPPKDPNGSKKKAA